jgi:hypothetical protein
MNENVCSYQCFPFSKSLLQMQIKVQRIVYFVINIILGYIFGV